MKLKEVFNKPKIIAVVGDVNEAKSNLLYYLLEGIKVYGEFKLYTYGLRSKIKGAVRIYSVKELEEIKDSIIILDELMSLWDLDNRMAKKLIENTLRLIHHNNNILIICALPENLKKFICGKVNEWFYKKCTLSDFINGSRAKRVCEEYKGVELGSSVLTMEKGEALYFNGKHYFKIDVPYLKKFDSKKKNVKIVKKAVKKIVKKRVTRSVESVRE